jgi:hypothetical protein
MAWSSLAARVVNSLDSRLFLSGFVFFVFFSKKQAERGKTRQEKTWLADVWPDGRQDAISNANWGITGGGKR